VASLLFADFLVLVHGLFIAFVVCGALLVARWRWLLTVHLVSMLWGAAVELAGWTCPLTPLENWARVSAGAAGYDGGFIDHYLVPIIYPEALTREIQVVLGALVLLINGIIYTVIFRKNLAKWAGFAGN